jgi:tRNA pseudouridine38-40 synthase
MDNPTEGLSRRIKMIIEYDGTEFVGWQSQTNGRTVQDTIQQAFRQFTGTSVAVTGAGRTDSGVHARGQVAHATVASEFATEKIYEALNGILPRDIAVLSVEEADTSFHARYSARERRYSYTLTTVPTAIDRRTCWHVRYKLTPPLLQECAACLQGEHDFRAFTRSEAAVHHHRCTVVHAGWREERERLIFTIHANRFLHTMVRSLVGTMVEVARGYLTVEHFQNCLMNGDRRTSGPTAPALGLVLEEVVYE